MVGGQSLDLALAKGKNAGGDAARLRRRIREKFKNFGAYAARSARRRDSGGRGLSGTERAFAFCRLLGDAYQLSDDLLDFEEDGAIFECKKLLL